MTGMDWTLTGVIFILLGLAIVLAGEAGILLYRRSRGGEEETAALETAAAEPEKSAQARSEAQMAGTENHTEQKTAMERRNT